MEAEKKLKKLTEHLDSCIAAWEEQGYALEMKENKDEDDKFLLEHILKDLAIYRSIRKLLDRFDKEV